MHRQTIALVLIGLLMAGAGSLLATSRTDYQVDLGSVVEIWSDLVRDVDHLGLTITRVSAEREMEIGREIENRMVTVGSPILQAYVTEVGETLVKHVRRKGISYRFHIVGSKKVNAYAIPGGGVYVTTAMLDFLKTEAELAVLLGHEISHVDLKHCIERLQYELAARKVVGDDLATIIKIGYGLVGLGFSEQQELEADAVGVILAAQAGYDPHAGIALFERLAKVWERRKQEEKQPTLMVQELGGAVWTALEQYFATHPPAELRIGQLKRVAERNARVWQGQRFYIGRTNYRDRVPRGSDERSGEWRTYAPLSGARAQFKLAVRY